MFIMQKIEKFFSKGTNENEKSENQNCSICLQKYDNNKLELECGHYFHIKCIIDWNKRSDTCPICRKKITIKTHPITNKEKKEINVISILIIISILILILSLISWSRTSFGLKKIAKKVSHTFIEIFKNIFQIINLIFEIIIMFLKGIFYAIMKICKNVIYILFMIIKILYNIISLVIIIILSILMLTIDIIIDCMNFIIFIVEILFKII